MRTKFVFLGLVILLILFVVEGCGRNALGFSPIFKLQAMRLPYDPSLIKQESEGEETISYPIINLIRHPGCPNCFDVEHSITNWLAQNNRHFYVYFQPLDVNDKGDQPKIAALYSKAKVAFNSGGNENISPNLPFEDKVQQLTLYPILALEEYGRAIKFMGSYGEVFFEAVAKDSSQKIPGYVDEKIALGLYQSVIGKSRESLEIYSSRPRDYNLILTTNYPLPNQGYRYFVRGAWPPFGLVPSRLVPAFRNERFFDEQGNPIDCQILGIEAIGALLIPGDSSHRVQVKGPAFNDPNYQNEKNLRRICSLRNAAGEVLQNVALVSILWNDSKIWWVLEQNLEPLSAKEYELQAKAQEPVPTLETHNSAINTLVPAMVTVEVTKVVEKVVEAPPMVVTATPEPVVHYKGQVTIPENLKSRGNQTPTFLEPNQESQIITLLSDGHRIVFRKALKPDWLIVDAVIIGTGEDGKLITISLEPPNQYFPEILVPHPWEEVQPW